MESPNPIDKGNIAKTLIVYLGSAWVFIEAINFLIDKYDWSTTILDILILLVIFGLPAVLIYTWFQQKFTRKAIILQALNGIIAIAVIVFTLTSPGRLNPTQLRLLKFKDQQKQLAESIQSLVILPFDNYTGSEDSEFYVEGMHASLITDLGQIGALRVISKTSSRFFKGVDMSIPQIASELGVDAAVEGSISCLGSDSVCVQIRLINASGKEQQLWVQDYRVAKDQILNFYNNVTKKISEEINIVLTPQEESLLATNRTVDPEAYDAFLRGHQYFDDLSEESLRKALNYLNEALENDPDWEWAPLYSGLAKVWVGLAQMGFESPEIAGPKIYGYLQKAIELDPNFADSHFTSGIIAVWWDWNWEEGEKEFLKAMAINPNDVMSRIYYAHLLMILQRPDEALAQGHLAVEIDPLNPLILSLFAVVQGNSGDWNSALTSLEKAIELEPGHYFAYNMMDFVAFHCKEYDKVFDGLEVYLMYLPIEDNLMPSIRKIYEEKGFSEAYNRAIYEMELLAEKNYLVPLDIAMRYNMVNQPEKAMEWLEKGFAIHDPNMPYIGTDIFNFDALADNPKYTEILTKMNLKHKGAN